MKIRTIIILLQKRLGKFATNLDGNFGNYISVS